MADENPAHEQEIDLFGNPIRPLRDRRGRPSFSKSKENQDFVAVRSAAGWSNEMISNAIGCDAKTLRKHFSRELQQGRLMIEGECLDVLMQKMRTGHAPSIRQLLERTDRVAPAAPRQQTPEREDQTQRRLGVKEQRLKDAGEPDADYGTLYDRIPQQ